MRYRLQKRTILTSILVAILLVSVTVPLSVSGQTASGDRDIRTDSISTGNTTTVVVTVQIGKDGFSGIIEDSFDGSVADASVETTDTAGGNVVVAVADETGATVGIENADANNEITIEYTITAAPNEGTIVIEDASSTDVSLGQDQITVSNSTQANTDSGDTDTQPNDTETDNIPESNNMSDESDGENSTTNESNADSQSNTGIELPGFGTVLPIIAIITFILIGIRN